MKYVATLEERIDDKLGGLVRIIDKRSLDIVVATTLKEASIVILREDFATKYFTPSGIVSYISNSRKINKSLVFNTDEIKGLEGVSNFAKKLMGVRNLEELFMFATKYEKEFMDTLYTLCKNDSDSKDYNLTLECHMADLMTTIDRQEKEIEALTMQVGNEQLNKNLIETRLDALVSRINYQYNAEINKNKLFYVDRNSYDKIVYIKEITRVQNVDSFVYYLKEILTLIYGMPARLCVIEAYYASDKPRLYPSLIPHYALKERDVIQGDILMLGLQPKLMTDILKNASNVSIIIILDRGGYAYPHIKGNNVEYFYTASDLNDVPTGIPKNRVISYSEDTLNIEYIGGFDSMDSSEKMAAYSSLPIIKKMVGVLDEGVYKNPNKSV